MYVPYSSGMEEQAGGKEQRQVSKGTTRRPLASEVEGKEFTGSVAHCGARLRLLGSHWLNGLSLERISELRGMSGPDWSGPVTCNLECWVEPTQVEARRSGASGLGLRKSSG